MPARSNVQAATGVYQQKMSGRGSLPDVVYKEENQISDSIGVGERAKSCVVWKESHCCWRFNLEQDALFSVERIAKLVGSIRVYMEIVIGISGRRQTNAIVVELKHEKKV
jgi:hypothetical protein